MMREFGRTKMMVPFLAGAMMALVGCSGSGEDSPTPVPATPTPTPTPPPMNDYFRVTSMSVGTANQGVDLNGDGTVDNGIEDALDEINQTIYDAVNAALDEAGVPEPQQAPILQAVQQILDSTFSVEAISSAINAPIESGDRNYLMNFHEVSSGVELGWYLGAFKNTGYTLGQQLSLQAGSLDASGNGLFGPDDLTLTLSFTSPNGDEPTEIALVLEGSLTEVSGYNSKLINNALAGGAISIDFLLGLVETALVAIQDAVDQLPDNPNGGGGVVIPVDDILTQLETALVDQADLDLDNDGSVDAFSIGLVVNADLVTIVE